MTLSGLNRGPQHQDAGPYNCSVLHLTWSGVGASCALVLSKGSPGFAVLGFPVLDGDVVCPS